jgi:hypothetical protein
MPLDPKAGYVRMTHSALPGVEEYATTAAYRGFYYAKGWRAPTDDPTYSQPGTGINGTDFTVVPAGWGKHWRDAKREAASRVVRVHVWGDSITVGDDASSDNAAGAAANSTALRDAWRQYGYVGVFRDALQARHGNAGEGYQPFGLAVTTGTWTNMIGFGAYEARATAAASATWKVKGTTVRIYHRNASITGSFRYQVDGGGFTTVTPPTDFGVDPGVVSLTGLTDTEHTIRVEWVSGTVGLNGVRGERGTTGILVDRCAQHGISAGDFTSYPTARRLITIATTSGSATVTAAAGSGFTAADIGARVIATGIPGGSRIATVPTSATATLVNTNGAASNATATAGAVTAIVDTPADIPVTGEFADLTGALTVNPAFSTGLGAADLVVFAWGVNDSAGAPETTADIYADALSKIIRSYSSWETTPTYTPDFVLVVHHIGKWFDADLRYPAFVAAGKSVMEGVNGAVIDMWAAGRRNWPYAQTEHYWSGAANDNSIHLSKTGHRLVADALTALTL